MARILILVLALAALPAAAQSFLERLEKQLDKHTDRMFENVKKEQMQTLAGSRDPQERLEAARSLSGHREPEIVEALGRALSDPDAQVRITIARGLWRIEKAAEPARPYLMKALDDSDPNVVAQAAGALQALGMKEAELATTRKRVFASPQATAESRYLVARNLIGHEPDDRLLDAMIVFLEQSSSRHNTELAEKSLERLVKTTKDRKLIAPLKVALGQTRSSHKALLATLALFDPKPEGWPELLGQQLQSPDSNVRYKAVWELGRAGGMAAGEIDKVVAALQDPDKSVRRTAARSIGEMGEATQAVPAAMKARVAAAGKPALSMAMEKDEDADVRAEAKTALAKLSTGSGAAAGPNEAGGMAVLRQRKIAFDEHNFFRALHDIDVEAVTAFLDAGMSVKTPVKDLGPPLRVLFFGSRACAPNERPTKPEAKAMLKVLLERGADPNAGDQNGNTPLMEAASKGCDREIMRALIKAGAKINATNASGLTPFEMGLWMGHDGLEELLAAGYRLPPDKVKLYLEGYKDRPAAVAMTRKAAAKK